MDVKKNFLILTRLSWRNVWKNRRRTILTLVTIMIGSAMIITMQAFQVGSYEKMIEDAIAENTGHIQVHEKGYWDNQTIDYAFKADDGLIKILNDRKDISAFSRRVHAGALLSFRDATSPAIIQAIEPDREKGVGSLHKYIVEGRYLEPGDKFEIAVGQVLAKNLGAGVGDRIALISQGFDGSIAAEYLTITGIFKSPNPEYNRNLLLMNIATAEKTFTMMGFVTSIAIRIDETRKMQEVRDYLRGLPDFDGLEVMGWDELMPEIVQFIVMDRYSGYIFVGILYLVVAFGILNTIQMSVFERIREFGVMLAIGTRPLQVRSMVLMESFFIAIAGICLGALIGSLVSYYFTLNPIDFSSKANEMEVWGITTMIFPAHLTVWNLVRTSAITVVLSVAFTFFPAKKASMLNPIEAIRHL